MPRILNAVDDVNHAQKTVLQEKIERHFEGDLRGRTIAVWGLAFKPQTDDIREAPALVLIERLLEQGAKVQVHDPEAMENVKQIYGERITYAKQPMEALPGADALAIMTEWKQFLQPDFDLMRRLMRSPVIVDGRNVYSKSQMKAAGFTYYSIGRATVS